MDEKAECGHSWKIQVCGELGSSIFGVADLVCNSTVAALSLLVRCLEFTPLLFLTCSSLSILFPPWPTLVEVPWDHKTAAVQISVEIPCLTFLWLHHYFNQPCLALTQTLLHRFHARPFQALRTISHGIPVLPGCKHHSVGHQASYMEFGMMILPSPAEKEKLNDVLIRHLLPHELQTWNQ